MKNVEKIRMRMDDTHKAKILGDDYLLRDKDKKKLTIEERATMAVANEINFGHGYDYADDDKSDYDQ
jgi:hypothetical protein